MTGLWWLTAGGLRRGSVSYRRRCIRPTMCPDRKTRPQYCMQLTRGCCWSRGVCLRSSPLRSLFPVLDPTSPPLSAALRQVRLPTAVLRITLFMDAGRERAGGGGRSGRWCVCVCLCDGCQNCRHAFHCVNTFPVPPVRVSLANHLMNGGDILTVFQPA